MPPPLTPQGQVAQPEPEKSFIEKYWMYMAGGLLVMSEFAFNIADPTLIQSSQCWLRHRVKKETRLLQQRIESRQIIGCPTPVVQSQFSAYGSDQIR